MNNINPSISERLYTLLLCLYPHRFRREFGEEMMFVFSQSLRAAQQQYGHLGTLLLWCMTLVDLLKSLPSAHMQEGRRDEGMMRADWVPVNAGVLSLSQPAGRKSAYELRTGNALVGTLLWQKSGRVCVAETAEGSWVFREQGLLRDYRITARAADSDADVLTYRLNWTGMIGTVRHVDGREFKLRGDNWLGNRYALVKKPARQEEEKLLALQVNSYLFRLDADLEVQPILAESDDAALLALFGCYVALIAYETNNMMR